MRLATSSPGNPCGHRPAARHASGRPALVLGTGVGAGHEVALTARPPLACRCGDQVQGQLAARPGQEFEPGQAWPGAGIEPAAGSDDDPLAACLPGLPQRLLPGRIGRTVTGGTFALIVPGWT